MSIEVLIQSPAHSPLDGGYGWPTSPRIGHQSARPDPSSLRPLSFAEMQFKNPLGTSSTQAPIPKRMTKDELLKWLFPDFADIEARHRAVALNRVEGTGNWLRESKEYKNWINRPAPQILYCHGEGGVGKSVISSKVIDSLSHDIFTVAGTHNVGLTYFYFDYKNQERQDPKYLLKALIRQLAGQVPVFRPYIEGLYLQCEGRAASLELSDLFYCFDAICRDFDHAFVVLDALNEIESSKRITLFENVLERMFTSTSVKLFITSRPGSIPASFMSNVQLVHMDGNTGDIQKYLDQKIDSRMFPGLHDAIRKEILSNANGIFLVAITQLNYVRSSKSEPNEMLEQLKLIGRTTLFGIYEKGINRVMENENVRVRMASITILSWLFHACRPLTVRELSEIVCLSHDELTANDYVEAIAQCDSFLAIGEWEGEPSVGIRHETVQTFLAQRCRKILLKEENIAEVCLRYLLAITTRIHGVFKDLASLKTFVDSFPFSRYAARNWAFHLKGEPETRSNIQALFETLVHSSENLECIAQLALNTVGPEDKPWGHRGKTWVHVVSQYNLLSLATYGMTTRFANLGDSSNAHADIEEELLQKTATGFTGLHFAVLFNNVQMVDFWLRSASWNLQDTDNNGDTALHDACNNGFEDIAVKLLEFGAETNVQNYEGSTPLHFACGEKAVGIAAALLRHNANPNMADDLHWTPLHIASKVGSIEVVELLIGVDVDVHARVFDWTAFHIAIWNHHLDIVRILLREGCCVKLNEGPGALHLAAEVGDVEIMDLLLKADPDMPFAGNAIGKTPLHDAAKHGQLGAVKCLLQAGVDLHAACQCCGATALYKAAENGHSEVVHELLLAGADVNAARDQGITTLHTSTHAGHEAVVRILLARADLEINAQCAESAGSLSAIRIASLWGHAKIVELLMEAGVDPRARPSDTVVLTDASARGHTGVVKVLLGKFPELVHHTSPVGDTPLYHASRNGHVDTVRALLDFGASSTSGPDGTTPLQIASLFGHKQVVEMLLQAGPKDIVNHANLDGFTALHSAAQNGSIEVLNLLLDANGPFSAKTPKGVTPLHVATWHSHIDFVHRLLLVGATYDDADSNGNTPLFAAAEKGNLRLVDMLLEAGANAMWRSNEGNTALHFACRQPNIKVVERILKSRADPQAAARDQWRPLHVAILHGHRDVANHLFSLDRSSEKTNSATTTSLSMLDMSRALTEAEPQLSVSWGCLTAAYFDERVFSRAVEAAEKRIELDPLNSELPYDPEQLKHGNNCDNCKETVVGFHHRCTSCKRYSLCDKCFSSTPQPHPEHQFITTPSSGWVTQRTRTKLTAELRAEGGSALQSASRNGQIELVQAIVNGRENAEIDLTDPNGYTSLHVAAAFGHTEVVQILLENTADVNAKSNDEMTPLLAAALEGRIGTFNFLRTRGDLNVVNIFGQDALYLAAEGGYTDIVAALVSGGFPLGRKTKWGWTALDVASYHGHVKIAKILITQLPFGIPAITSAFQIACRKSHITIIRDLLSAGADLCVPDEGGLPPLHEAWARGDRPVWEELVHIQGKAPSGQGPLGSAALYREIAMTLKAEHQHALASSLLEHSIAIYRNEICRLFPSITIPDTVGASSDSLEDAVTLYENSLHLDKPSTSNDALEVSLELEVLWSAPTSIKNPAIWNHVANEYCLTMESDGIRELMSMDIIQNYVEKTWGSIGTMILSGFLRAARVVLSDPGHLHIQELKFNESNDKKDEAQPVLMVATRQTLWVGASLMTEQWKSLGECILWIEQVIGSPTGQFACRNWSSSLLADPYTDVPYERTVDPLREEALKALKMAKTPCLTLQLVEERPFYINQSDTCWSRLIKNSYVARRKTKNVEGQGKGVRVPFNVLLSITSLSTFVLYGHHPVLVGLQTALVPIEEISQEMGSIQWHLILAQDSRLENSILDDRVNEYLRNSVALPVTSSALNMVKASTDMYLGWTKQVKITLGTNEFSNVTIPRATDFPSATESSRLKIAPLLNLSPGIHANIGPIVTILAAMTVGATFEHGPRTSLQTEIPSLASNFAEAVRQLYGWTTVIYDVDEDQAWLVPMLNVVVYMIHVRRALYSRTTFEIGLPSERDLWLVQTRLKRIAWLLIYDDVSSEVEPLNQCSDESKKPLTFATLLFNLGKQLLKRMNDTKVLYANHRDITIGLELSDMIKEKRNWNPKRVDLKRRSCRCWSQLVRQEPILICKGIDRPIQSTTEMTEPTDQEPHLHEDHESHLCRSAPKGSLFCMVELLKLRMTGELEYSAQWEGHGERGYIGCPRNSWRWWLKGDPFGASNPEICNQDGTCLNCWSNRAQKIEAGSKRETGGEKKFTLQSEEDLSKGLCFGAVEGQESYSISCALAQGELFHTCTCKYGGAPYYNFSPHKL